MTYGLKVLLEREKSELFNKQTCWMEKQRCTPDNEEHSKTVGGEICLYGIRALQDCGMVHVDKA